MNDVPAEWSPSKVKYLARYINGYPFKPSDWSDQGRPIIRIQNLSNPDADPNYFEGEIPDVYLVKRGDLLLSWSATLGAYEWPGPDAWLNQHIFKVNLDTSRVSKTYYRWLADWFMRELDSEAHGSTMQHLTKDRFGGFKLRLPPPTLQETISNYLDRETARIDGLIVEKERMLALLEEKRAALISNVVTRGLDPGVSLKPSGQEWLGVIPAHWRVERAKNLFTVRDERSGDGSEELLTVSHITGVTSRSEKDVYMFEADDKAGYKRCMPGDLAINTLWAWMGAMGISPLVGIVSPDYHVYTSKGELLSEYVDLLCRSRPFVAEVSRWSKGVWSSRLRLYPENFFEMRLPVPPQDEQVAIVRAVERDQRNANALRESLQLSITLAKERRSALITAAVTGQIPLEEMTG